MKVAENSVTFELTPLERSSAKILAEMPDDKALELMMQRLGKDGLPALQEAAILRSIGKQLLIGKPQE